MMDLKESEWSLLSTSRFCFISFLFLFFPSSHRRILIRLFFLSFFRKEGGGRREAEISVSVDLERWRMDERDDKIEKYRNRKKERKFMKTK